MAAAWLVEGRQSLLVGVSARDPVTYLAAAIALLAASVAASYLPAHRATAINPVEALGAP